MKSKCIIKGSKKDGYILQLVYNDHGISDQIQDMAVEYDELAIIRNAINKKLNDKA